MVSALDKHPVLRLVRSNYLHKWPVSIDLELTNRCNLHCPMCWLHGEAGVGDRYEGTELATHEVLGLIRQMQSHRPFLYLGGGEPLMRRDLVQIIEHAKAAGLPVGLTTNGTLFSQKTITAMVDMQVDRINFSLDGDRQAHDEVRGAGTFDATVGNLRRLLEYRAAEKAALPVVTVDMTVNPALVGHLAQAVTALDELTGDAVDAFTIHHLWFIRPDELAARESAIRSVLGVQARGSEAHVSEPALQFDPRALATEVSALQGQARVRFFPDLRAGDIGAYYSGGFEVKRPCLAPFIAALIKPDGEVRSCPDEWMDGYPLGNIREESFTSIWNGERAKRLRKLLYQHGPFAGCERCSWMHCF